MTITEKRIKYYALISDDINTLAKKKIELYLDAIGKKYCSIQNINFYEGCISFEYTKYYDEHYADYDSIPLSSLYDNDWEEEMKDVIKHRENEELKKEQRKKEQEIQHDLNELRRLQNKYGEIK